MLKTLIRNSENAPAYGFSKRHALAQYAATGCFGRTFYASEQEQLKAVLDLCGEIDNQFLAKTAIYSRTVSHMKDMPALLCAYLASRDAKLHEAVFARVIDSAKMLRTYVQIIRSGMTGRRALGSAPKRLIREWLALHGEDALFRSSAGRDPSFGDVLKMVHPRPDSSKREAFYGYMLGRSHDDAALPELVKQFEAFKTGESLDVPDLPLPLLTALPMSRKDWTIAALRASWQTLRMNLNTFARHGVFEDSNATYAIEEKLGDPNEIAKSRVFPYQLLAAWEACGEGVPYEVREALSDAIELAVANVPSINGRVVVCPDVSGSMQSPVTGVRKGATTAVRCIDVAALVAAAVARKNPSATVLPFSEDAFEVEINPRESVFSNARKLAHLGGGGTNCSAPLRRLNKLGAEVNLVIFISDNESWMDARSGKSTAMMTEWHKLRQRNRRAQLVCIDIQPNRTTQAEERRDILNVGGFADSVFSLIDSFSGGELEDSHWVGRINAVKL